MLVKAGRPETAVVMYRNARLAREFETWPYRAVLEARITSAATNVEAFRRAEPAPGAPTLMVRSAFASEHSTARRSGSRPAGGVTWWRRWASNPRPETLGNRHLHH